MHLPFQKVKKSIVWGRYIDCDNRYFFLYIGSLHIFTGRESIYILQRSSSHILFNVECCKLHEKLLLCHRNYGMMVILLSFLFNYDNLRLKLHYEKRSYPDERWLSTGRFKVGSVPGKSVALAASIKVSKSIMSMMQGH